MGLIRLLLAIAVLDAHLSGALRLPFINGGLAVEAFFMISGFYMGLVLTRKYSGASIAFWVSRALRIFPGYWVVLACAVLERWIFDPSFFVAWSLQGAAAALLEAWVTITIIGQDVMLWLATGADGGLRWVSTTQGLPPPQPMHFMLVPQAWTLSLELVFYLMAPALNRLSTRALIGVVGASVVARVMAYRLLGLDFDPWTDRFFPFELGIFVAGIIAFRTYERARPALSVQYSVAVVVLVALAIATYSSLPAYAFMGLPINAPVFLLALFAALPFIFCATEKSAIDRSVGDLSYPFYLAHVAVIFLLGAYAIHSPLIALGATLTAALALRGMVDGPIDRRREMVAGKAQVGFDRWRHRPTRNQALASSTAIAATLRERAEPPRTRQPTTRGISTNAGGSGMENIELANPPSRHAAERDRTIAFQLKLFAGKVLIVAAVSVASFLIVATLVERKMSEFAKIGGSRFWESVQNELDRAADPDRGPSPETKQRLLANLRAITAQWKPFLAEAEAILTETAREPAAATSTSSARPEPH